MLDILLDILADPSDKGNLVWNQEKRVVHNPRLGLDYPFLNGFFHLTKHDAVQSDDIRSEARYEGLAEWYDSIMQDQNNRGDLANSAYSILRSLLGKGEGIVLDIGCGTGLAADITKELGYSPIGVDLSQDQLRIAAKRLPVVLGDSAELPISDHSVHLAYSTFTTTDWENLERSAKEIFRVLAPGGRYIDIGVHPCFYGAYAEPLSQGEILQKPGYNKSQFIEPNLLKGTVRSKVGAWHRPVSDVINTFLAAGFKLVKVVEGGQGDLPQLLALSLLKE
ncbi:methyltransferase domain-containing protein [Leptospira selangorensis]|uniref:class I SAM-dependent methyltransferase n=1 Tax=Leptospira selangorensis TaxID=2484982 RepID=UPI0010842179|nr:methyltransferase domain-containing protein [Leptospira selangorensis]TGK02119.1 methyltransferase domain-containing protein [Leptospira selangorensis]